MSFYKSVITFIVLLAVSFGGAAQQKTASGKPNRFIPYGIDEKINSSYNELNPVFSLDENTLYFSRVDHPENHYGDYRSQDIWYSEKQEDGSWSEPQRLKAVFNNNRYNALYSISADGKYLVAGRYNKNGLYKGRGLSIVTKTENGWSNPVTLKIPKIKKQDRGLISTAFLNNDGDELLLSYSSSWQRPETPKLRYSIKKSNGKWTKPKVIKDPNLNKKFGSIETPYMSSDGQSIYFSGYQKGSAKRYKSDIYMISRSGESYSKWTKPEKVTEIVNTTYWENYFKLFNEGNWAVFNRADVGDDADIFIVKLNEPRPYVDLQGIVKLDDSPFKDPFRVVINGQVVDSVRINRSTSSYAVQLPLGGKYEVQAKAEEMEAKIEVIDATDELEYLPLSRDLELSLLPFLDLSGNVMVNNKVVTDPFEILINGYKVDSLNTDFSTGTYSVKLPLGKTYEVEVRSGNYIPGTTTVDVSSETTQIRVHRDLQLKAIPYVQLEGRLLSKETNAPINSALSPKIMVNGEVIDSLATSGGIYEMNLPWGHKYVLQLMADDHAPIAEIIDLVTVENYTEIKRDLFAQPLEKYATLTGKVLNMKTMLPISSSYTIEVNGAQSTNSTTDLVMGTYEAKVSLGQKFIVTAKAENYFPISEVVDLIGETENVKVIKDLLMMPLEIGEHILLNNIFFESGSTNLKSESFADIDRVVDVMRSVPNLKIEIGGHTDSSGKDSFNLALSNSRARSVTEYILSKGIDANRVTYKGYGEANPVASNLTAEGRAKNRRVEFIVLER